jgi:hypothetical protein
VTGRPDPLEPRFFAQTWQGDGELALRGPLARLPGARHFTFRSFTTVVSQDFWIVHDETRWEDGRIELRDGLCRRIDQTTLRMTYDDMLGGTEIRLRPDGYDLGPYTMLVAAPGLPLWFPVRCSDSCRLKPNGSLIDTIELAILGVRIGRQIMHLEPQAD